MFSKEAVEVTNSIHAEGKDAQKVSKNEVLKAASRILKFVPNGEARMPIHPIVVAPPTPAPVVAPVAQTQVVEKKSQKPKAKAKPQPEIPVAPEKAPEPVAPHHVKAIRSKKPTVPKPELPKTKPKPVAVKVVKTAKETKSKKPEAPARSSVTPQRSNPQTAAEEPEPAHEVPESELPPEKQPLHLPAAYDPKKYPHYDVQSSAYSMLLSTLTLVTHYERFPGYEDRQKKLEGVLEEYLKTCNQIKIA